MVDFLENNEEMKQHGTMFTCLSSRVIHTEAANFVSTDSFIMCLQRFIEYRGNVRLLRSHIQSTFDVDSGKLPRAFTKMNHQKMNHFMQDNGREWMSWKRNPPVASNMGGCVGEPHANCQKDFRITAENSWC